MKTAIIVTPVDNIGDFTIIDAKKVERRIYDNKMDTFTFLDTTTNEKRCSNLQSVSIFNDVILENDKQLKILKMITNPMFV